MTTMTTTINEKQMGDVIQAYSRAIQDDVGRAMGEWITTDGDRDAVVRYLVHAKDRIDSLVELLGGGGTSWSNPPRE